ncbi:MAG: ABC transporter permease [Deltaproteobacteria bacterium]
MIIRNISRRFGRVWQRNFDVYCATWKLNFIPPLLEPLLYLFAFGLGLGGLVKEVAVGTGAVSYLRFIGPGLVATAVMNHGFFETTYASFVRMYFQKTFDAILATPLMIEDIVFGEVSWGMTKSFWAGLIMFAVVACFGLLKFPQAVLMLPVIFIGGCAFAAMGMCFTALVKNIEMFNLPVFLFITPMFLFSGIFFPLDQLPVWARGIAWCLPLTYLVSALRALALGLSLADVVRDVVILCLIAALCTYLSLVLMKRRLIK